MCGQFHGTLNAFCNSAMRERAPRTGLGFLLTILVVVAAVVLALKNIIGKIPRP